MKKEEDLLTFILRLLGENKCRKDRLKKYFKKEQLVFLQAQDKSVEDNCLSGYWQFVFNKENIEEEVDSCLNILKSNRLIRGDKKAILSPTAMGILIVVKRIKVETYLFLKNWLKYSKKGEISNLEILFLLSLSPDGKILSLPFSPSFINDYKKGTYNYSYRYRKNYWNKLLHLIFEQNEEDKKLYRDNIMLNKVKEEGVSPTEDDLTFKKTHFSLFL